MRRRSKSEQLVAGFIDTVFILGVIVGGLYGCGLALGWWGW